ncbi:NAD(P)H-dependent flavin oxidoreductase [Ferviditalea candida]|uniref:Probable nitronate monooxygenase n=1 Tax=Ferviditalea candida TaxID=3108399 RepID=A0ABU5ZHV8_9BACL|nr:nitronate monooxygenase family protein [Paenibacillaceae bacterium T2]
MNTRITELFNIRLPIIQGGLAYLAYAELAAAVSNAGGLGQITAMSLSSQQELRNEIIKTKQLTSRPFGVNFAIGNYGRPFEEMLHVALEEGVETISVTGGNPQPVFEAMKDYPVKKLVLVASVRQAQKAESLGADAVIAVGQEGGGHLGKDDTGTMVLVPRVVDSVSIPVIASGGIGDGRGLMAALALGAEGIEMGTRFIATSECIHAHERYVQRILEASETDTRIIKRSIGSPGRVVYTPFLEKIIEIEKNGGGYEELKYYISGESNQKFTCEGKEDEGFGWAGQVVGLINDTVPVQELFERIENQAGSTLKKLQHGMG